MVTLIRRVLDATPCHNLDEYLEGGGGRALDVARRLGPEGVIDEVEAAGLRGRGGAGFPTGRKWRTIAGSHSAHATTSVVVNGAEGEPGTFKDRALLRTNPYKVIEGALIAAVAVHASDVVICLKRSFHRELVYVRRAVDEVRAAAWSPTVRIRIVEGPSSYLFGEETALLEVVDGRQPFPRVDPPFRRGIDPGHHDVGHSAANVHLAAPGGTDAAPALVNNVETTANAVGILRHGADWYRSVGTVGSPGTLVCTVTGHTRRHGVGEVVMGTTLREAITAIGGGPRAGHEILAVLSGVANPVISADLLDTPLGFDEMAQLGSGLGAGGFIVFQDGTDMLAVAHGVARFLAVESCGQCEPCKRDGLVISAQLGRARGGQATAREVESLRDRLNTVTRGARCALASQQEQVVGSMIERFGLSPGPVAPSEHANDRETLILPVVDIVDGHAILDTSQLAKQPDWSYSAHDSGRWPAAVLGNQPVVIRSPDVLEDEQADRMDAVIDEGPQVPPGPPGNTTEREVA